MAWANLDDGFFNHPKVVNLVLTPDVDGLRAIGLWALALSWACKYTIEKPPPEQGIIPANQIQAWDRLLGGANEAATALADAHLWDRLDDGRFRIHDFREWSKLEVREAKVRGGIKGANRRWHDHPELPFDGTPNGSANGIPNSSTDGSPNGYMDGSPNGRGPEIPNNHHVHTTSTTTSTPRPSDTSAADAAFDRFWAVYPRREAKIAARRAWDKAIRKVDPQVIIDRAVAYGNRRLQAIASDSKDGKRFTAQPATWLNAGRWDDDPGAGTPEPPRSNERAVFE